MAVGLSFDCISYFVFLCSFCRSVELKRCDYSFAFNVFFSFIDSFIFV